MLEPVPLISVIVPVYNIEKQLDRCVQSILKQSYPNVELILVDDGSPDQCGKMCDDYAASYNMVHVIHQSNKGPAYARSVGVSVSAGKYIAFCDGDDYFDEDILEYLYDCMVKNDCEISFCAIKHSGFAGAYDPYVQNEKITIRNGHDAARNILLNREGLTASLCNALYLRTLFENNDVSVNNGYCYEDLVTGIKVALYAKKVCISNIQKYNYCYRASGSSSFSLQKRCEEMELAFSQIEAQIALVAPDLQPAVDRKYMSNAIHQILKRMDKNDISLFYEMRDKVLQRKVKLALCGKTDIILLFGLRMGRIPFYFADCIVDFLKTILYSNRRK